MTRKNRSPLPRHHFKEETLMAYAAGTCPEHFSLIIASHLTYCPTCRQRLRDLEAIGGATLDDTMPAVMSANALDDILDLLDQPMIDEAPKPVETEDSGLPSALDRLLPTHDLTALPWKRMAPGIHSYKLSDLKSGRGTAQLLKIAPGVSIPPHSHRGNELTFILAGSFIDELGRFQAGDVADLDEDITHQPIVDTDEDCICLIATEDKLVFKKVLPRLLQPLIGI